MSETWKRLQNWLTVVVGVLLFVAPFAFGATANQPAAWTAYAGGVLLVIAGLWSLSSPANHFAEWAEIVIGVLVFLAPWVLGSRPSRRWPGARGSLAFSRWSSLAQSC